MPRHLVPIRPRGEAPVFAQPACRMRPHVFECVEFFRMAKGGHLRYSACVRGRSIPLLQRPEVSLTVDELLP